MELKEHITTQNVAIIGILTTIVSYFIFRMYKKSKESMEESVITNDKLIHNKQLSQKLIADKSLELLNNNIKLFEKEIRKISKTMGTYNEKNTMDTDYLKFRNSLFTKDIVKQKVMLSSKDVDHTSDFSSSNYKILLNDTGGIGKIDNVIGFRLIKATIPSPPYNVTNNNNKVIVNFNGSDETITLVNGFYTNVSLGAELETKLKTINTNFSVTFTSLTKKYTITNSSSNFYFKWKTNSENNKSYAYKLFGFNNLENTSSASITSDNISDLNLHYIDLVIPELPYISCKTNKTGKNIIDRIPIHQKSDAGTVMDYYSHANESISQSYFFPISLDQLSIQLYDDSSSQFFQSENMDNFFEFEVTLLKNTKLMNSADI